MARGQPDYGLYTDTPVAAGISDPGEAAARLGSINIFDRRGWTVWFDDFEAPSLKWTSLNVAPGEAAVLSSTVYFAGSQSVYLNVPAGELAASNIKRRFPLIRTGKIGVELWVQGVTTSPGVFRVYLDIKDGSTPYRARFNLYTATKTITIDAASGAQTIASDVYMSSSNFYFLPIKMVVDMDTDLYTRLLIGEREFDISAHSQVALAATTDRYVEVTIEVSGHETIDSHMYIDNFILTQNEP